jgi:predicted transposase YbfD/YdcC
VRTGKLGEREAELTVAPRLLEQIPLGGLVVTSDALHTQRKTARRIVDRGGDYFMVVKENQPTLYADIELLFREPPPREQFGRHTSRGRHGDRREVRELQSSTAVNGYVKWPHVGQVCRIERRRTRKGKTGVEISYAVTSLGAKEADPERLARLWRGHWGIENRLHWVRDVTMGEDGSQVRKGSAPQVMAALRNLSLGLLRRAGVGNVAAALRRHARYPHEALALMGIPYEPG